MKFKIRRGHVDDRNKKSQTFIDKVRKTDPKYECKSPTLSYLKRMR